MICTPVCAPVAVQHARPQGSRHARFRREVLWSTSLLPSPEREPPTDRTANEGLDADTEGIARRHSRGAARKSAAIPDAANRMRSHQATYGYLPVLQVHANAPGAAGLDRVYVHQLSKHGEL